MNLNINIKHESNPSDKLDHHLDPFFNNNPSLSERSHNKQAKHHSACSYNVSSNNSFGLDEEVMLNDLNDELDLDFNIDSKLKGTSE